jgi:predicted porin
VAASVKPIAPLKLMASYQKQDQSKTVFTNHDTKAWILGANYTVGAGKILLGYGQKTPDGVTKTKQTSVGYEYSLSARTYLYADASSKRAATTVNFYGVGIHHNF